MLVVVALEPLHGLLVARVADEAEALGERGGTKNSGSDSIELHSETQQPHMMQSASF